MRNRNKENYDLPSNLSLKIDQAPGFGYVQYSDSPMNRPISPIRRNKIADSLITNVFDQYARSTSSIQQPLSNINKAHTYKDIPQRQIDDCNMYTVSNDPQTDNEWKNKYQQLYRNYQAINKKYDMKTKQIFKMQEMINSQARTIRELEQENIEINNRFNGLLQQNQRSQRLNNQSNYGSARFDQNWSMSSNGNQGNRFYVEQLERSIDNLQKENKRLIETLMRKYKNNFDY